MLIHTELYTLKLTDKKASELKDQDNKLWSLRLPFSSCSISIYDVLYRRNGESGSISVLMNNQLLAYMQTPNTSHSDKLYENSGRIGTAFQQLSDNQELTLITNSIEVLRITLHIDCLGRDPGPVCSHFSSKSYTMPTTDENDPAAAKKDWTNIYVVLSIITAVFLILIVLVILALLKCDCCGTDVVSDVAKNDV
uniref:Uncharacterized protein n=1 Tax=Amphimedon queenslandica TaxID=400682 RepID=A0A1X7VXY7_AMPQE